MNWNLPNKITMARIVMVPLFVVSMYYDSGGMLSMIIFAIAAASDAVDGYIARKYNLVSNFGKFLDPLADKILVMAAFIMMTELGALPGWASILVVSREIAITGFRVLAADKGVTIAASGLGKIKTISQMLTILLYFAINVGLDGLITSASTIYNGMVIFMAIATLYSGADYITKNIDILKE